MSDRKYLALSVKHTEYKWKFGMPCWLWGKRTADNEPRSFAGYTMFPEEAELYTLEEFADKYRCEWMKTDAPVRLEIGFCKKYKKFDTVMVDYDDYITYCKAANLPTRRDEDA